MQYSKIQVVLGRLIRAKRTELGYSQESFSDEVGIHRTYIGSVERGERNISLRNMIRISNALGVALSSLLAEAEAQSQSAQKGRK